jgi:PII-like signaling protein
MRMAERQTATRLRVYIGQRDRWHGEPLAHALVRAAQRHELAGATVLRGIEGFGAHSRIHALHPFTLSSDLPLVVEIIDRPDRVEAFLPEVDRMVSGGLVTLDRLEVMFYRQRTAGAPPDERGRRAGRRDTAERPETGGAC